MRLPLRTRVIPVLAAVVLSSLLAETARAEEKASTLSGPDAGAAGAGEERSSGTVADQSHTAVDGGTQAVASPDGGAPSVHTGSGPPPKRPRPDYEGRE